MRPLCRVAIYCPTLILLAACGGGGAGSLPNVIQSAPTSQNTLTGAQVAASARGFITIRLPSNFVPSAIMKDGEIPGSSGQLAAVFVHHQIKLLGTFANESAVALSVNSRGDAVGSSASAVAVRAVLFKNGGVHDLGRLPATSRGANDCSIAQVIGEDDEIYGNSEPCTSDVFSIAKYSASAAPIRLNPVMGFEAAGIIGNINSSGQFSVNEDPFGQPLGPFAAVGKGLTITPLFSFPNHASAATWINDKGDSAGYIDPVNEVENDSNHWTAYIQSTGATRLIPYLPNTLSMKPSGINNHDDVVGTASCTDGLQCPTVFLFARGILLDLRSLFPSVFASGSQALPGISECGAFIVKVGINVGAGTYYIVKPVTCRE